MEELVLLLMRECEKIYFELKSSNDTDGNSKYGKFPQSAVITYYGRDDESLKNDKILKKWKISNGRTAEIFDYSEPKFKRSNGMYFAEAVFSFSIDTEEQKAYLSFQLGSRYGRGFVYDLVKRNDKFTIENPSLLWLS